MLLRLANQAPKGGPEGRHALQQAKGIAVYRGLSPVAGVSVISR